MAELLIPVLIAYLCGAIPFALIISRLVGVDDIRRHGSGNLGATNVWRVAGPGAAIGVLIGDIGKGVAAVLIAGQFHSDLVSDPVLLVLCAAAAVLGHMFPVFAGFRGGKGVNTALGTMIVLMPVETLIALGAFLITVAIWRMVSLGSILAAAALPLAVFGREAITAHSQPVAYEVVTVALAVAIIVAHRRNISRILAGQENRLTFGSSRRET
jgi:glycerol-3-phosphate acyltransferase PlsY